MVAAADACGRNLRALLCQLTQTPCGHATKLRRWERVEQSWSLFQYCDRAVAKNETTLATVGPAISPALVRSRLGPPEDHAYPERANPQQGRGSNWNAKCLSRMMPMSRVRARRLAP
jgi:hypothetical protein